MEHGEVVVYKTAQDAGLQLDPLSTVKESLTTARDDKSYKIHYAKGRTSVISSYRKSCDNCSE